MLERGHLSENAEINDLVKAGNLLRARLLLIGLRSDLGEERLQRFMRDELPTAEVCEWCGNLRLLRVVAFGVMNHARVVLGVVLVRACRYII